MYRESNILNNTSFLDAMSNTVGALAFLLLLVVLVTVALKLNYFNLSIETEKLPNAVIDKEYNVVLAGTGGNEPYKWEMIEGNLPKGLEFITESNPVIDQYGRSEMSTVGKIVGVPQERTPKPVKLTFQLDDTQIEPEKETGRIHDKEPVQKSFFLDVLPKPYQPRTLVIKTESLPTAIVNSHYMVEFNASGGYPPYKWQIQGELPPGLVLDDSQGRISGVPNNIGEWTFTIKVKDARGSNGQNSPNVTLKTILHRNEEEIISGVVKKLNISTLKIPSATVAQEYDLTIAATGGIPPYQWALEGKLPEGLSFDAVNGRINGTPKRAVNNFPFSIKVKSSEDALKSDQDSREFQITVKPAPSKPYPLQIF